MIITSVATSLVNPGDNLAENFYKALNLAGLSIGENSIIVVSSKVFSYSENRIVEIENDAEFKKIVMAESEKYYPGEVVDLSYKHGLFVANAGIDRSNVPAGQAILWPADPQKSCDEFRLELMNKFGLKNLGVIMIDSICYPGRMGVNGGAICYSGIVGVTDERGKLDIFGNPLRITKVNKADAVASASNLLMGEAAEIVPYCIVSELDIEFTDAKFDSIKELSMPLNECIFNSVYKY
jgi:coenzyme F420-0:L-glutamate ligase/coenzyme F420-1:gamma-L-glutamate ligase